jgi:secretion/DNA translocation related TadE-like protein
MMVLTMVSVLVMVAVALTTVTAMVHRHRIAQSAADLGALAGAAVLQAGGDGCAAAADVVAANGAALEECLVSGQEVLLRVRVTGPRLRGYGGDLGARSRAGPASAGP